MTQNEMSKRAGAGAPVYNELTNTVSPPGGFVADSFTRAEDEVLEDFRYETPDQIRDRKFAEDAADEAARLAQKAVDRKAERIAVRTVISRRAAAKEKPTVDELRWIADTSIEEAGEHKGYADAALLAQTLLEQHPDAAYIAFEDEAVLPGRTHNGRALPTTHTRKAVILNAGFVKIGTIEQYADDDEHLERQWSASKEAGSVTAKDELEHRLSRVFPAIHDRVPTLDLYGHMYNRRTQELRITDEARSFDDGSHPAVPNLFTLETAAAWVPGPLPVKPVAVADAPKPTLLERFFGPGHRPGDARR